MSYHLVPRDYRGVLPTYELTFKVTIPCAVVAGCPYYRRAEKEVLIRDPTRLVYLSTPTPSESGWVEVAEIADIASLLTITDDRPPTISLGVLTPLLYDTTSHCDDGEYVCQTTALAILL